MTKVNSDVEELATFATSASVKQRQILFSERLPEIIAYIKTELSSDESESLTTSVDLARLLDILLVAIPRCIDKRSRLLLLNIVDLLYDAYLTGGGERGEKLITGALGKCLLAQTQQM
jgi:hypothetical protein